MYNQIVDESPPVARPLFPFCAQGRWGYINREGEVVIKPRFDVADDFLDGLARVSISNEIAYIDQRGDVVFTLPPELRGRDWMRRFSERLAGFSINGKCGYLDRRGRIAIQPRFDDIREFSEGLAPVNVGGKEDPMNGIRVGGKWGFVDKTGQMAIQPRFSSVAPFSEGLAPVMTEGSWAYIDRRGRVVLTVEYQAAGSKSHIEEAGPFSEGFAYVTTRGGRGGGTGFIDKTGKLAIKPQFMGAGSFSEGLAAASDGKQVGYIDRTGRFVIGARFDGVRRFSEGLAAVRVGRHWGFIDQEGGYVVRPHRRQPQELGPFNDVEDFSGGLARVHVGGTFIVTYDGPAFWEGGAWYYINRKGEMVRRVRLDSGRCPGKRG